MNIVNGKPTEMLLTGISSRLSGRQDCANVNYTVTIGPTGVSMNPLICVYPNRYRRCETDKLDIVSFIHTYKMSEYSLSDFVFGTYQYQSTFDHKRRKWVKIA